MNSYRLPLCLTLGFVLCTVSPRALATSFVVPTDTQLIEKADAIVRGVVTSSRVVESERGFIETVVEIAVTRVLKGQAGEGSSITVRSPGGNIDGRFLLVESAAHFAEKEEVLLFLTSEGGRWTPTDMTLGKFRPALTTKGYSVLVRDDDDIAGWTPDGRPHLDKVRLDAAFIRFIEDTVRGEKCLEPYEADTRDVIAPAPAPGRRAWMPSVNAVFAAATYSARFVSGDGSRRYPGRWPTAVMNAGITFFKNDTNNLTGADDGGIGAIRAGLAAWTNDGGSAVNLAYGGTRAELARDDSKNMIVFDDPQGLIPGTWTGSGVIATTYLYGTGAHTFDGQAFLTLVGSDIVFQDGYTASELSLEEAMTHEIGHAIGLRHSNRHFDPTCPGGDGCAAGRSVPACDPAVEDCSTASIMNATVVDGLGYALQTWDISAAKALYPVANAVPLPPTNVIALAALPTGVFVSWSGSDGATSYNVWRWDGVSYTNLGPPAPPAALSFIDVTALPNQGYIYQVQALNASGASALSGGDIAIAMIYTDPNLAAGTPIKAVHLTELRTAANLMLALTGSVIVPTYTDPTIDASTTVKAVHFQEVEAVMIAARTSLGLSIPAPLGIVSGAVIPASHVIALRTYTQ